MAHILTTNHTPKALCHILSTAKNGPYQFTPEKESFNFLTFGQLMTCVFAHLLTPLHRQSAAVQLICAADAISVNRTTDEYSWLITISSNPKVSANTGSATGGLPSALRSELLTYVLGLT